jgi:hypothetical protein
MRQARTIILTIAASLLLLSIFADVMAGSWWPTIAVISAIEVAGVFTSIDILITRGAKPSKKDING